MGTVSLTAINAFGDERVAQRASTHLTDHGYTVVAFDRLEALASRNGLLAILGAGPDHLRMIAMRARFGDRVAAFAVVGGPASIMLGNLNRAATPTLLVADPVNRRERRRIIRRLPRGSALVTAADFDAAMQSVVVFLDRTSQRLGPPVSTRSFRPVALRLAPVALVAPAAAVMLAGNGAAVAAACSSKPADGLLTITCDGDGADLTLSADEKGQILLDGQPVASLREVYEISILTTRSDDVLTIDESQHKFAGDDGTPVLFELDMGDGTDELKWIGSSGDDSFKLSADGIDVPGGDRVEHKVFGVERLDFDLGDGDDELAIDGFKFSKLDLAGGAGDDQLKLTTGLPAVQLTLGTITLSDAKGSEVGEIGHKDFDGFQLTGDGSVKKIDVAITGSTFHKLELDGGGVGDLEMTTAEPLISITDSTIAFKSSDTAIGYTNFDSFKLTGDGSVNKVDIAGFKFQKMELDGGGGDGLDELKLASGLPAVQLTDSAIKLSDADGGLVGEVGYKDFDSFQLTGDGSVNKVDIAGFKFKKMELDGGGGADELKLTTSDGLLLPAVQITDEAIKLGDDSRGLVEIGYKDFDAFQLTGDGSVNKVDIAGFKFHKLDLDGGGGADELKLTSGETFKLPAVQLTDESIKLGDDKSGLVEIGYKDFDAFQLTGDGSVNKVDIAGFKFHKMELDGGGGGDELKLTSGETFKLPAVQIGDEAIKLGDDSSGLVEIGYKDFDTFQLVGDGSVKKVDVEVAGSSFHKLDVDGAGGGELKLTSGETFKLPAVQLSDESIKLGDDGSGLVEIGYKGFDSFQLTGDGSVNKIDIAGFKFHKMDLDGGGGADELKLTASDGLLLPAVQLTDEAIKLCCDKVGGLVEIGYKDFDAFQLVGDGSVNKIDIAGYKFHKLELDGGGGLDELKLSTGESLVTITDSSIAPGTLEPITLKDFESLSVFALTDVNHTFDGSKVRTLKLTLEGGAKNDVLRGGALDDILTGGSGRNTISGGGGIDTVADAVDGSILASNSALIGGGGLSSLSSIEALKLTGDAGPNLIDTDPFRGPVTLDGGGGNDLLIAGDGNDVLLGGTGHDLLIGGGGDDAMSGGQGDDTLLGGKGNDTLDGGPGRDYGDGGPGTDIGKSLELKRNIER